MLMITRTENRIEFGMNGMTPISIDAGGLAGCMLAAERAPCGRIRHSLVLLMLGREPVRIEGRMFELTEIHQVLTEAMDSRVPSPKLH